MLSSSSNTSMILCNQYKLDIIALCMCSRIQTSFMFVSNQVEGELDRTPHPTVGTVQSLFQCKSLIQSNSISYLTKHSYNLYRSIKGRCLTHLEQEMSPKWCCIHKSVYIYNNCMCINIQQL